MIDNMEKLLKVKTDLTFKAVFGRDKEECKEALKRLLNAILGINIAEITYVNPLNIEEFEGDKETEFDIEIETETKERIDLEIQLRGKPYFNDRLAFYCARLMPETIESGEDYKELSKSMVICLADFKLFNETEKYDCRFKFIEKQEHFELTDKMEILIFEMAKLPKNKEVCYMTETEKWLYYLKYAGTGIEEELVEEIVKESEGVNMANEILRTISADERMRSIMRSRERFLRDKITELNYAEEKGIEKGIEKGKQEGIIQMAREMLNNGLNMELVSTITKLPKEVLETLK
mgnify:CR=1 FL=1